MNETTVGRLRCAYRTDPLGIDLPNPALSWELGSDRRGVRQTAYQVIVVDADTGEGLWDTGRVESAQSAHVPYVGAPLRSRQRVTWRVRIWDEQGGMVASAPAGWEMGLLGRDDWQETARWIGGPLRGGPRTLAPSPYLRKAFDIGAPVVKARLYITALGVYECHINGQTVGDDVLMPGWTDFSRRVRYQVYDITASLQPGENAIGAVLGDGWACGHLAWGPRQMYVDRPRLLAQLEIQTSDGETLLLVTDGSWRVAYGPILESDMLMGESYDARLDLPGWDLPGYDEGAATFPTVGWRPVREFADTGAALVATNGPAVRRIEEFRPLTEPRELSAWPISRYIFDFGQNLTGWIRLRVRGPAGTTLTLRYAEVLALDGSLYTENLRSARATDHYTLRGEGEEEWEPRFTFHGFRYVEVAGWPGAPGREALDAIVIHSDMAVTGEFECSDPLLNQLQHNILWGQKGNFLDVPTDCPQRDERLGWTGDAQVFARTAMFNMDVAAFFTKYQQDMADAQAANGAIPPVAPEPHGALMPDGGPAWADGFIIIPWTVYLCYGDRELLAQHYDAMARFIGYLRDSSIGFIRSHPDWQGWHGFGDWLALDGSGKTDGGTPKDLIGTAYFAHSVQLMARIATVLGKLGDAAQYQALYHNVRDAYLRRFVTADGLITGGTQTAYVLALRFGLLPESMRSRALEAIVRDIRAATTICPPGSSARRMYPSCSPTMGDWTSPTSC
jgi:alpha-L-rhamnosidase